MSNITKMELIARLLADLARCSNCNHRLGPRVFSQIDTHDGTLWLNHGGFSYECPECGAEFTWEKQRTK